MVLYLNIALILLVISGLICAVFGLITLISGCVKKNKDKSGRGIGLTVLGSIAFVLFLILLIRTLQEESSSGEGFLFSSFIILFIFFPIVMLFVLIISVYFLVVGVNSLKEGFKRDEKGKLDVASIILGFVMITLLVLVLISLVMAGGVMFGAFKEGLVRKNNSSSSNPGASAVVLKYYLSSLIH